MLSDRVLVELVSSAAKARRKIWRLSREGDSPSPAPSGGRTPAAWWSGCCLKEVSCRMLCMSAVLLLWYIMTVACLHTACVLVSPGMPSMWYTMVFRCHGRCSVTSGRVLIWWTASSPVPPRKPSSPFSWPPPPPSAWCWTWRNWHISLPRLSLGRGLNQSDIQVIKSNVRSFILYRRYRWAEGP